MNKQVRRLKGYIRMCLPYRVYRNFFIGSFGVFIVMVLAAFLITMMPSESIPYDETNTTDYMYLRIDAIYPTYDHYYFVEDEEYIYVYYDKKPLVNLDKIKQIEGVPMSISDDELAKILPDFQKYFPDLKVKNVDEMTNYIGYYALDAEMLPMVSYGTIIIFISSIPLLSAIIMLISTIYYYNRYRMTLKLVVERNQQDSIIQQLQQTLYKYKYLKVALLPQHLVVNHPSPYVIDYRDIAWIYIDKKPFYYSIDHNLRIVVYDRQFHQRKIWIGSAALKKNIAEMTSLFEQLPHMNEDMLVGYNQINIQKFNELKQGKK